MFARLYILMTESDITWFLPSENVTFILLTIFVVVISQSLTDCFDIIAIIILELLLFVRSFSKAFISLFKI